MKIRNLQVGVIGSAGPEEYFKQKPSSKIYKIAFEVGYQLAKKNVVLITGGEGGVMKSASNGARKAGGLTIGIVGGNKRKRANSFINAEIVTGSTNFSEEAITISSSDGLIAVGGGAGTLQELALAYRNNKPIVAITGINGYSSLMAGKYLDARKITKIKKARSAKKAVTLLLKLIK